jgi:type II restriction enzyme
MSGEELTESFDSGLGTTPACDMAIQTARQAGKALLKFISPNDVGLTGSHQYGFYLPKSAWRLFSPQPPEKEVNYDHHVTVFWQDGRETESVVKWYGRNTRSEYRLTRFGRDFPFLINDNVGDLFVLIPEQLDYFCAFVLSTEQDIEQIQAVLGIEVRSVTRTTTWAIYDSEAEPETETAEECLNRKFQEFARLHSEFPPGTEFSDATFQYLKDCMSSFIREPKDDILIKCVDMEYRLFRFVERKICAPEITRVFESIDDFLGTARSILQRRMTRAGRSLENHIGKILQDEGIPFEARPHEIPGKPDIIIPGVEEYNDKKYPSSELFMLAVKRTCKDRWRQVLEEAPRINTKHLLTTQEGISQRQLNLMHQKNVQLVVPKPLHNMYPGGTSMELLQVDQFIEMVTEKLRG